MHVRNETRGSLSKITTQKVLRALENGDQVTAGSQESAQSFTNRLVIVDYRNEVLCRQDKFPLPYGNRQYLVPVSDSLNGRRGA